MEKENFKENFKRYFIENLEEEKIFEFRDYRVESTNENFFDLKLIGNGIRVYTKFFLLPDFKNKIKLSESDEKSLLNGFEKILKTEKSGACTTLLLLVNNSNKIEFENEKITKKLSELFKSGTEIIGYKIYAEKNNIKEIRRISILYER